VVERHPMYIKHDVFLAADAADTEAPRADRTP
jgi:hypothetical protein